MNGTPTFRNLNDLLVFLRSPDLQLDIPLHYGHGGEWEERGWFDILNRLRTPSQRPPEDLQQLMRLQVDPFAGPPGLFQVGLEEEPDESLFAPLHEAPDPLMALVEALQKRQRRVAAPPLLTSPSPPRQLFKSRLGDTAFFSNVLPVPPRRKLWE